MPPPPSDEKMINTFNTHKEVFDELREMIYRDGYEVVSMDPEWSKPSSIPIDVKQRYYELFRKIGVKQLQSYDGGRAQFSVWAVGLGGDGDYKQYQYRPSKIEKLVDSLDHLQLGMEHPEFYYRKIAEDWYLEYAHWP